MLEGEQQLMAMVSAEFEEAIIASQRQEEEEEEEEESKAGRGKDDRCLHVKHATNTGDLRNFVLKLAQSPRSGHGHDLKLVGAVNALAIRRMKEKNLMSAQKLLDMTISYLNSGGCSSAKEEVLRMRAITLNNNGCVARRLGDDSSAFDCFNQALQLNRDLQDRLINNLREGDVTCASHVRPNACAPLLNLSILQLESGEIGDSLKHAREAFDSIWEVTTYWQSARERIHMLICAYRVLSIAFLRNGEEEESQNALDSALSICRMYFGEESSTWKKLRDWNDSLVLFRDLCSKIQEEDPDDFEEPPGEANTQQVSVSNYVNPKTPPRCILKTMPNHGTSHRRWIFDANPGTTYDSQLLSKMKKGVLECSTGIDTFSPISQDDSLVDLIRFPRTPEDCEKKTFRCRRTKFQTEDHCQSSREVRRMILRAHGFATPNAKERVRDWIVNNIEQPVCKDDVRSRSPVLEHRRGGASVKDCEVESKIAGQEHVEYACGGSLKDRSHLSSFEHEDVSVRRTTGGKRCLPSISVKLLESFNSTYEERAGAGAGAGGNMCASPPALSMKSPNFRRTRFKSSKGGWLQ